MESSHPPHKHLAIPKDISSMNEKLTLKGDFANSMTNNNLQSMNSQQQGFESRRKTNRDSEIDESPGGFEFSMSYSPSNPTRTNTLSHRANSRNFQSKKVGQGSNNSIDFPKMKDFKIEDVMMNGIDENESHLQELESKRESVYVPLELAKYQIKNFEDEMKNLGEKHSRLVGDFERNYKLLENDTEQYYNEILEKWKEVVKEKILRHRQYYEDIVIQRNNSIDELHHIIGQLEKQNAELSQERECIEEKFNERLEKFEKQKNEAIKSLNESYKLQVDDLHKENSDLTVQVQNLQARIKGIEEKHAKEAKELKNLESLNNSLKENNNVLRLELKSLKEELSLGLVSSTLDSICGQVQFKAEIEERDSTIKNQEKFLNEFNQTIVKLRDELDNSYNSFEALKKESSDKYKVYEEKISQLKVMLHLERPKRTSRPVTPTDSARDSKTPERERSPINDQQQTQRPQEEERSSNNLLLQQSHIQQADPLVEQVEEWMRKKKEVDNQIKAWISNFRKQENRYPTESDKQPIKHLYMQHRILKQQIESGKTTLAANNANTTTTTYQDNSTIIIQPEVVEERVNVSMKARSMSPKRAQMMRLHHQVNNPNVSNMSINTSFDGASHLNTSTVEQSILQGTSFYHSSGLPMAMPNDLGKLKNENRSLREELHHLRLQTASKFEESDAVNQLRNEIQAIQRDKKFLKEKVMSLTKNLKSLQSNSTNDSSIIASVNNEDNNAEKYRLKVENENKIKEIEAKYLTKMDNLKQECKQQVADIIKAKDILISTTTQENQSLKDENNKLLREMKTHAQEISKLKSDITDLREEVEELKGVKSHLEARIRTEIAQRKKLHNIVEDMKGKVRVFCRVRPMVKSEMDRGCQPVASLIDDFNLTLDTKHGPKVFPYDSCFGPNTSQDQIFEDTKRLIQSAIDGYNVCIFAYGQTGSGKTYTMYGTKERPGITPRAIDEVYHILSQMESFCDIKVSCYMVELYMDALIDLLVGKENKKPLEIKEDINGMVYIQNVTTKLAPSKEDLGKLIKAGTLNRKTSGTSMNDSSSRSHLIVTVIIEIFNKHTNQRSIGKLSLVDLAGSERVSKANSNPKQLNEARAINKSLTALGDVISALSSQVLGEKDKFVPYRNNKLTMLMKDCLGGTAKTLMFVNVSPADYNLEETQTSLYYATRVKLIVNETVKNIETKEFSRMKEYLKTLSEERDVLKQILTQNGIPVTKREFISIENTPSKTGDDDCKFDEGPIYQMPNSDSFRL